VPEPRIIHSEAGTDIGIIYYGTTRYAALEAMDMLAGEGAAVDAMQIRAIPFTAAVEQFINGHGLVFVIEQNRDGQMRSVIANEIGRTDSRLISILNYDGMPITADAIVKGIRQHMAGER